VAHRSFCLQLYNAYSFTINTKEFYTVNVVGKESVILLYSVLLSVTYLQPVVDQLRDLVVSEI